MKKRLRLILVLGMLAAYLGILNLLVFLESFAAEPLITSFSDALWYSLITLSTIGYGDMYPLTPGGRVIGVLFVVFSIGFLAFLINTVLSLMTGKVLPYFKLRFRSKRTWYLFTAQNEAAAALAGHLYQENPSAVFFFPQNAKGSEMTLPQGLHSFFLSSGLKKILKKKQNWKGECHIFVIGEGGFSNYSFTEKLLSYGFPVYCRTEYTPDQIPHNLILFNEYDCCARLYWQNLPLRREEATVLLIGSGKYGERMLERALLTQVRESSRPVSYHVFGDWISFEDSHPQLKEVLSINQKGDARDSLFFHRESWTTQSELLEQADRILFCTDEEEKNLSEWCLLHRLFAVTGTVFLRTSLLADSENCFGSANQIFRPEFVMKTRLNQRAAAMHNLYRDASKTLVPAWEELGEFLRQSNIAAADHILAKLRLLLMDDSIHEVTPELCQKAYQVFCRKPPKERRLYQAIEHERWCRFHAFYNWSWQPKRDNLRRHHPLLRPFAELSEEEQRKDDYAWELLEVIAESEKTARKEIN